MGQGAPGRMDCEHNGKLRETEAQADAKRRAFSARLRPRHSPNQASAILVPERPMDNQSGTAGNRFCAHCGAPLIPNAGFCGSCGQRVELLETQPVPPTPMPPAPQSPPDQPANVAGTNPQGLKCPRCGSTQIQTAKRGWKWTTGMIGSGSLVATCMQCGNKF